MWFVRRLAMVASLALLTVAAAQGAPAQGAPAQAPDGTGSYIVTLRGGDPGAVADEHSRRYGAAVDLVYRHALRGYAANMSASAARQVGQDSRVAFVAPDKPVSVDAQTLPTGIDRVDGELSSTVSGDGGGAVDVDVACSTRE
jgi:subtilisin